jgi:hypothetical protein
MYFQSISGMLFDILELVKSELSFNYTLVQSENNVFGSLESNNEWSGQIGMVHRNEVDFSVMDITVMYERSQVCHRSCLGNVRPAKQLNMARELHLKFSK